jgi:membrane protein implicated in regulation of membrane protease activity
MITVWLWLAAGIVLCLTELVLPTAFVAFMMGISALLMALLAPLIPPFYLQTLLWLGLSTALIVLTKRFLPQPKHGRALQDSVEAETLTAILPGKTGRVLYEGNSWQARCEDHQITISAQEKVYVVGRQGTTLIVMPASLIHL